MSTIPSIKLIPRKDEHTVCITVELEFFTTSTMVSNEVPIGVAVRKALNYHYEEIKRREVSRFCGEIK